MRFEYRLTKGGYAPVLNFKLDQDLDYEILINGLCEHQSIALIETSLVYSCFGPIETIHEICTSAGIFNISWCGEGLEEGYRIYSDNNKIIQMLLKFTRADDRFVGIERNS